MTLEGIIAIVGQIATWIMVLIVFLTLREMGKQRRESYKPELIIPNVAIFMYGNRRGKMVLPVLWRSEVLSDTTAPEEYSEWYTAFNVTIHNVGIGAATNITLCWEYDVERAIQLIKDYFQNSPAPIILKPSDGNSITIGVEEGGALTSALSTKMPVTEQHQFDYLLPASVSPKGIDVGIPLSYKNIVSVLIFIWSEGKCPRPVYLTVIQPVSAE